MQELRNNRISSDVPANRRPRAKQSNEWEGKGTREIRKNEKGGRTDERRERGDDFFVKNSNRLTMRALCSFARGLLLGIHLITAILWKSKMQIFHGICIFEDTLYGTYAEIRANFMKLREILSWLFYPTKTETYGSATIKP